MLVLVRRLVLSLVQLLIVRRHGEQLTVQRLVRLSQVLIAHLVVILDIAIYRVMLQLVLVLPPLRVLSQDGTTQLTMR
jgi:hypothetical protein